MATLELDIAEEAVTQPARKGRRLGTLFWLAIGWMIFMFVSVIALFLISGNSMFSTPAELT